MKRVIKRKRPNGTNPTPFGHYVALVQLRKKVPVDSLFLKVSISDRLPIDQTYVVTVAAFGFSPKSANDFLVKDTKHHAIQFDIPIAKRTDYQGLFPTMALNCNRVFCAGYMNRECLFVRLP